MQIKPISKHTALTLLLVTLALAARWIPGPRTIDDSYITYRYAQNLLNGDGFVYNPGERVQGTTTPLYTLLMVGMGAVSGDTQAPFPTLALAVNAAADAITCLLLLRLGKRLGSERGGFAAALVWAVAPYSVTFAIGGLETSLYVLLLMGTATAYLEKRRNLTGLLGILSILTRPDALILIGPLMLDRLYCALPKERFPRTPNDRLQIGELLMFFVPGLVWAIFATFYFGSPIAHSVQAKLLVYHLETGESLIRLIQHYATPFLEQNWLGAPVAIGIGIFLYPFLYLVGARHAWRSEPRALGLILYPWLYLAVFAITNPLIFRWYLTPPLPIYFLMILSGADILLKELLKVQNSRPLPIWQKILPLILVIALPVASSLSEWRMHPDHGNNRLAPDMAFIKLELLYQQAAEIIRPEMTTSTVLAAGDVGVLGFFTPAQILDTVGLNSPQSLAYYPLNADQYVINYAIPSRLVLSEKPDWIVILEVYARKTLLQDQRFKEQYSLRQTLDTDIYGSQGMLIFQRTAK